jgi:hypothetical protein
MIIYFIMGKSNHEIHTLSRHQFSEHEGDSLTRFVVCCITKTVPLCTDPSREDLQPIEFMHPPLNASPLLWTQLTLSSSRARCVTSSTELPSSSTWPSGRRLPWKSAASCTKCRAQGPRRSVRSESDSMHSFGNGAVSDSVGCKNS